MGSLALGEKQGAFSHGRQFASQPCHFFCSRNHHHHDRSLQSNNIVLANKPTLSNSYKPILLLKESLNKVSIGYHLCIVTVSCSTRSISMDSSTSRMKSSPTDFAAAMAPSTAHTADFGRSMEVSNHESSNQHEQQPLQVPPPLVLPPAIPPQQQQQGGTVDSATATAMIMAGGPAGMAPNPFLFVDYNHNNVSLGPPCRVFESYYPGESSGHLYTEGLHQRGFPELFAQDVPRHRASLVIKNMYFLAQRMVSGIAVQGGHRSTDHDYRVVLVDMIEYRQHILMECMHGSSLPPQVQASMRILALHSLYEDAEEWGSFPPAPGGQRQRRNKILAAALFQKQQQITFDEDDIAYLLCNMGHFCRLVEVPQALDVIQRLPPALAEPVYRQYCLNILGCASQQASPPAVAATAAEDQQEKEAASNSPSRRRGSATSAASATNKTTKTKPKTANRRPRKPLKQVQPSSSKADCTPKKEGHKSPIKKRKPTKKTPTKNVVRLLTASPAKKEERSYSKQQLVLGSPKVVSKTVHSKNQIDTNALDDATVATTSTSSQQEMIQGDKDPLPSSSSGPGKNLTTTSSSSPSSSGLASPAGGKEFSELYLRMKQEHAASNGTLLMGSPSLVHNMATSTSSATPIVSNKQTAV